MNPKELLEVIVPANTDISEVVVNVIVSDENGQYRRSLFAGRDFIIIKRSE